ncbi:hypothetical protein [Luteibacter sp. OK325]|jgi:hypothetical protein|uniref:hypothetical protein n=1 Tax=Luteibacter sp. OK325 TaxID=2135670 RepID=UPI0011B24570|nr:hypothetical protein [Luteibacter sp. OK325]
MRRANRQVKTGEACSVSDGKHRSKALSPGKTVIRTRPELQARLDALAATLHQLNVDGARQQSLWEAFELYTNISVDAYVDEVDRAWWCEQVCAAAEHYGLANHLWLQMPDML